jgi:predicted PurR-regulated permease PerM
MVKNIKTIEMVAGVALVGGIVIGCWLVLRPFISPILWAAILCSATWPLYELLLRWLRNRRTLASFLMTLILAMAILIPFTTVAFTFKESIQAALKWLEQETSSGVPTPPAWVDGIWYVGPKIHDEWVKLAEGAQPTKEWIMPYVSKGGNWLLDRSLDIATAIFHLTMSVLIAFFLYRDGEGVVRHLRAAFQRIGGDTAVRLLEVVRVTVRSVVYGVIGTAIAQGIVAAIGFAIVQVPGTALLALFTFLLSFIPFGPPIVWIGVMIWLFAQGHPWWGGFMLVYGTLCISSVDNLIKPLIISRGSKLSFIVMFIGVLGGVAAFGFLGVFVGPTLLAVGFALMHEILRSRQFTDESGPSAPSEDSVPIAIE